MNKSLIIIFALLVTLASCDQNTEVPECATPATVRDYTGLDGCGFVFELEDGTILLPHMLAYCGTPPLPKEVTENPLYNFEFIDGKEVLIDYEFLTEEQFNVCMAGIVVKITCITTVAVPSEF